MGNPPVVQACNAVWSSLAFSCDKLLVLLRGKVGLKNFKNKRKRKENVRMKSLASASILLSDSSVRLDVILSRMTG